MEAINDAIDRIAKKINVNVKKKATIAGSLNELANALGADKATGGNIYEALRNVNSVYSGGAGSGDGEGGDDLAGKSYLIMDDNYATSINGGQFAGNRYKEANFPACTSIGAAAFTACSSLTSVNFPVCTSIGPGAFANCSSLTSVNFPACTSIDYSAFNNCSSLTSISFPVCTSIGNSAFNSCYLLTSVDFPVCENVGAAAFTACFSLTSVNFPVCTSIEAYAFQGCSSLTSVDFPACTGIGSNVFYKCYNLLSLYLVASSVCTLAASNAFTSTPIGGYTESTNGVYGSIYVPASLYESYKTAAEWDYFADRFVSIA